jgi:hypothetical protein
MTRAFIVIAAPLMLALSGCASVSSGVPTTANVTGEAWYVKTTRFLALPVATHIYFCPKPMGKGPAKCIEALVHETAETLSLETNDGFGVPQQQGFGVPQQQGFGAPQPGYGAPQQPGGYGAPVEGYPQQPAPGTPMPPTPGY